MAKSMVSKLNARIASWSKRGTAWAKDGLDLMVSAVEVAVVDGNIDPMKRIVAALDGNDQRDAITIFAAYFPLKVVDGELSVVKGWQKKLPEARIAVDALAYKSFRSFAADLRPAKDEAEKPAFDLKAYLKGLKKLNGKAAEGAVPADLVKRMNDLVALIEAQAESAEFEGEADPEKVVVLAAA